MGGVSRSGLEPGDGAAIFAGHLSLDSGGGFASVRGAVVDSDFSACAGIELRVKGDGNVYRLRLHDTGRIDGVAWQARFPTRAGEWQTLELPFPAFEASFRGRVVPDAPPLATGAIRQVGLMIAERQAGPFRLEVAWARGIQHEC
jgi:monofunctional biosynthetic peptidoglycan transglycosylase